jgi:carbonic anhydrase/acetyltransferase-like protein (isoleucine patch superfamily)
MPTYKSNAWMERVANHWQATNAVICADVEIGVDANFWFGVTVRGDVAPIRIGARTNLQEGVTVHCDTGEANVVEDDVTVGHGAVVHGRRVGAGSLIGMKAVLLGGTEIGKNCLIGAGAVVPPGLVVPDGMVVMGVPGKIVRPVREEELAYMRKNCQHYVELAAEHVRRAAELYQK